MKIAPETWKRVDPLLTEALAMDEGARVPWLTALRSRSPDLFPALEALLATHERLDRSGASHTISGLSAPPAGASPFAAGQSVGPFRLVRPLGRGGMGEVWLAEQVDGRVRRAVALKLPTALEARTLRAERFARERDILARLEHPHIARLYDAGAAPDGQPWLAMEYVEGEPLDAYLRRHPLAAAARLALFRQVLSAVAHAHRHLVVHRDLKPANILVGADGQVKLLDFGIAKLLDEDAAGSENLTRLGGRVMTLRYAAPEQVEGEAITTATDVYALGVVLHEMLTGASPYRAVRESRTLTAEALRSEDIAMPSALERTLAGDLDAILLKALRRDPARRYASVGEFDDDIARFLARMPVRARAGTWRYLAGRFFARHRLPLAAAAVGLAMVVASVIAIDAERRHAVEERARAERHLDSVRKLANTLIFDVHADIENVPGTIRAREKLVKTSLAYLDALVPEVTGDPSLVMEVAGAYRKIAAIQGGPGGASKGDLAAAVASYEKAGAMLDALAARRAGDIALERERAYLRLDLARASFAKNDARWSGELAAASDLAARLAAMPGASPADQALPHAVAARRAAFENYAKGQSPEQEAAIQRAIEGLEALAAQHPREIRIREALTYAYSTGAAIFGGTKATPEGLDRAIALRRRALAAGNEVLAKTPADYRARERANVNAFELARLLSTAGRHAEAERVVAEVLEQAAQLRASHPDPGNTNAILDHLFLLNRAAKVANASRNHALAIQRSRDALAVAAQLPPEFSEARDFLSQRADAAIFLGWSLFEVASASRQPASLRLAQLREAREQLATGAAQVARVRAAGVTTYSDEDLDWLEATRKRCDAAIRALGAAPDA